MSKTARALKINNINELDENSTSIINYNSPSINNDNGGESNKIKLDKNNEDKEDDKPINNVSDNANNHNNYNNSSNTQNESINILKQKIFSLELENQALKIDANITSGIYKCLI